MKCEPRESLILDVSSVSSSLSVELLLTPSSLSPSLHPLLLPANAVFSVVPSLDGLAELEMSGFAFNPKQEEVQKLRFALMGLESDQLASSSTSAFKPTGVWHRTGVLHFGGIRCSASKMLVS